jgi:hypothetical protein
MAYQDDDLPESDNIEDRRDDDQTIDPRAGGDWEQRLSQYQQADHVNATKPARDELSNGNGLSYKQDLGDDGMGGGLNQALAAVNNALMYGRKKFGLGQDEGVQSKNYAEGGAVDDEEDVPFDGEPASGSPAILPSILEDRTPASGSPPGLPEGDPEREEASGSPGGLPEQAGGEPNPFPIGQHIRKGAQAAAKFVMAYLTGEGAADPQQMAQVEQQVDPNGQMPEDQRKLQAIKAVSDEGGPEAGFGAVQAYRKKYDGYRAHAAAALQAGDIQNAARSASQAYANVPDGQSVVFGPGPNGVTATVNGKQQINLSTEAFNQFLTGDAGQYDHVLENGGVKALQQLGQGGPQGPAQDPGQAQGGAPAQGPAPQRVPQFGPTPTLKRPAAATTSRLPPTDSEDLRPYASPTEAARQPGKYRPTPDNYRSPEPAPESKVEQQSRKLFPMASQEQQRQQWIAQQEQQGEHNRIEMAKADRTYKVDEAKIRGEYGVKREETRATGTQGVAQTRANAYDRRTEALKVIQDGKNSRQLQVELARIQQQAQSSQDKTMATVLAKQIANVPFGEPLPPQSKQALENLLTRNHQAPQPQTQPQGQAPAAPQQSQPAQAQPQPGERKQFKQGWGVWDGTKWVPEQ